MGISTTIYSKVTYIQSLIEVNSNMRNISLIEIIISVKEAIFKNIYANKATEINKLLNLVISGDLESKYTLKKDIKKILNDELKESQVNDLIEQYHINYFDKIYTGTDSDFDRIINKPVIYKDDDINLRLDTLTQIVFQELWGLSVLDNYSYGNIKDINEIITNNSKYVLFQIKGKKERIPKLFFKDDKTYEDVVKNKSISYDAQKDLKSNNPEVLCQRINGARVTVVIPPYSKYYSLNIRFFNETFISKKILVKSKTSTSEFEECLDLIMHGRPNIFVIGDMGVGKTTYLLRLVDSLSDKLSILTLEPMFELNIDKYFTDRDSKALQFLDFKSPYDAFKTGLRQNRDIILDGEVRSPAEAEITLQAMTRQGRGSMGSFHTTSCEDFIFDYKNMLMKTGNYTKEETALYDIARAVDILILLSIDRSTGHRYVKEAAEIKLIRDNFAKPYELNSLFKYDKSLKTLIPTHKISDDFLDRASEYEFTNNHLKQLLDLYKKIGI